MKPCPKCSTDWKKVYHEPGVCSGEPQKKGLSFMRKRSVGAPAYKHGKYIGNVMDYGKD